MSQKTVQQWGDIVQGDLVGRTIGRYRVLVLIGSGGMGTVYKAWDEGIQRDCVLKVLSSHLTATPENVSRFLSEARVAAQLNHANIARVFEVGNVEGTTFIAMEYIDGESIATRLSRGALSWELTASVITQVASALDYLHSRGIIHVDVKPTNIILTPNGSAILTDFGLARVSGSSSLTDVGTVLGTPTYMAPEIVRGAAGDARSDVYSLSVVAFQMLAGQPPFTDESPAGLLHQHVYAAPPSLRSVAPKIPPTVDSVMLRGLAKDPSHRFQSAGEFAAALANALRGTAGARRSAAPPTGIAGQHGHAGPAPSAAGRPVVSGRFLAAVAACVLSLVMVAALLLVLASESIILLKAPTPTPRAFATSIARDTTPSPVGSPRPTSHAIAIPGGTRPSISRLMSPHLSIAIAVFATLALTSLALLLMAARRRGNSPSALPVPAVPMPTEFFDANSRLRVQPPRVSETGEFLPQPTNRYRDDTTIVLRREPDAIAWFLILTGPSRGEHLKLGSRTILGRASTCDVVVQDSLVSREHAMIVFDDGEFTVVDLSSSNGTSVNGQRITTRQSLRHQDEIRVGDTSLLFVQALTPDYVNVETTRRLRGFEDTWSEISDSVHHD